MQGEQLPLHNVARIHFVGVGGAGMSGIAEVLRDLGYDVTGSDIVDNYNTRRLVEIGVGMRLGHDASNVAGADVVVYSSAISIDNPELCAAREARIPIIPRAEMLAELMRFRRGIAVAGSHGKTTTTSLIANVLVEAGLDPTFVIGGRVNSAGSNARLGSGSYLVAEADESDGSFLKLNPLVAVLTNIDNDHLNAYGGDFERLNEAFEDFLKRLPFYGVACLCIDDRRCKELLPRVRARALTYGFNEGADFRAADVIVDGVTTTFTVYRREPGDAFKLSWDLPGEHNILNALAAIAVATELNVPSDAIITGVSSFAGIDRRFQVFPNVSVGDAEITLIDDYGHHPTEIAAVIAAVRKSWPGQRLVVVFQPHRFSRTHDLFDDFIHVLADVDELLLLEVYAAGEKVIPGFDGRSLSRAVRTRGPVEPVFVAELDEVGEVLTSVAKDDDVVLLLGAGSIGSMVEKLVA
ncbi:MAG: UDP-N-acetylmuramate--L-alanine ligase [Pseudomonadota bacterium]